MTCLDCKHLYFDDGEPGYSDWTPGTPMEIGCRKNHWSDRDICNTDDLRDCFNTASGCKDFEQFDKEALKKRVLG